VEDKKVRLSRRPRPRRCALAAPFTPIPYRRGKRGKSRNDRGNGLIPNRPAQTLGRGRKGRGKGEEGIGKKKKGGRYASITSLLP